MQEQRLIIDPASMGIRLDVFLSRRLVDGLVPGSVSRAEIQRLIRGGEITLNGQRSKPSARLRANDLVHIQKLAPRETRLKAEPLPLEVIFEDRDILVVNKKPGMVVHPAAGRKGGTLVNALLHHFPSIEGIGGERRPGIVHRLDKDTSGIMIVAKNSMSYRLLAAQFKRRRVEKHYLALVWGRLPAETGVIDRPIGRHRSDRKKMSSRYAGTRRREATTKWRVHRVFDCSELGGVERWVSWVGLKPLTGRTHQIRVHLAELGHPLVGDRIYGKRAWNNSSKKPLNVLAGFPRQVLHAGSLGIDHPRTGQRAEFAVPLADDIAQLLEILSAEGVSDG